MDNQLIFALGSYLAGLASELLVRLIGVTGDIDPAAPAIAVTESASVPGLYRATMAGAAGNYGAVLLRVVGATEEFVASVPTFRWSGAEFVQAAVAGEAATAIAGADLLTSSAYTAPNNAAIAAILEDTSINLPAQIDALPRPLDATATQAAAAEAIAAWPVAKPSDVQVTVQPTPVTGQFEEGDRTNLQALLGLAKADEAVTPTRYQKLAVGTAAVLLDKDVADDGAGNITLTERVAL